MSLSKRQRIGLALAIVASSSSILFTEKRRKKCWVKKYLLVREKLSLTNYLLNVLEPDDARNFLRMESEKFKELLRLVTPYIKKEDTWLRDGVTPRERLAVTLRFLATGHTYEDLKFSSLISAPLLSKIIPETCRAIYKCLKHYIQMPRSESDWLQTAELFENKWNFNHCLGACDGKHITIEKPSESGSMYYNYKGYFSVVLFAVVNANYEFIYVHTGTNSSVADGAIFKSTNFYEKLMSGSLNLPQECTLRNSNIFVPYVFLGDSAISLDKHFMKPFPLTNITHEKRIFNYRLSRARRVVENAFGILATRFRVFQRPLNLNIDNVDSVVLACCALHNFLRKISPSYISTHSVDRENINTLSFQQGDWRRNIDGLPSLQQLRNQQSAEGNDVRNKFMNYFNSDGSVSFQNDMVSIVPM